MAKKAINNGILNDLDDQKVIYGSRYCCKKRFFRCRRHCYHPNTYYYTGRDVEGTNNHLNLQNINFDEYIKEFDKKYNEVYPKFSQDISTYNSLLDELDILIETKTKEYINSNSISYLNNISDKIKSIINEKLGNNLLTS